MVYNLATAGDAVGLTKSAIRKAIKSGRISATQDPVTQGWSIDPAELHRVYPPVNPECPGEHRDALQDTAEETRFALLRELVESQRETIADLRRRLDRADERLQVYLTPPPPVRSSRRRWWQRFLQEPEK